MSKKQRQQALMAVLALTLVVLLGRRLGSVFTTDSFGGTGSRSSDNRGISPAGEDWRAALPEIEELDLSALEVETEALGEGRDPFQIGRPEPAPRPQPAESDVRRRIEEARQRRTTEVTAPVRPPAPSPPAVDVVYLGSFGSGRLRLAVFTDGSEIFNVPEGDTLKEKFILVKIGMESADLGFVGFPDVPAKRLEIGG